MGTSEAFLTELEIDLTYDPAVLLLSVTGVYSQRTPFLTTEMLFALWLSCQH